jgi:hypothetical protein
MKHVSGFAQLSVAAVTISAIVRGVIITASRRSSRFKRSDYGDTCT